MFQLLIVMIALSDTQDNVIVTLYNLDYQIFLQ